MNAVVFGDKAKITIFSLFGFSMGKFYVPRFFSSYRTE
jgi:hypothetical protein